MLKIEIIQTSIENITEPRFEIQAVVFCNNSIRIEIIESGFSSIGSALAYLSEMYEDNSVCRIVNSDSDEIVAHILDDGEVYTLVDGQYVLFTNDIRSLITCIG